VATYVVFAALTAVFAGDIVALFAESPESPEVPIAITFVYAACVAVVFQGISGGAAGPLDAAGDTKIPFASQFLGMFCVSIPLAYVGAYEATPAIDVPGLGVTIPEIAPRDRAVGRVLGVRRRDDDPRRDQLLAVPVREVEGDQRGVPAGRSRGRLRRSLLNGCLRIGGEHRQIPGRSAVRCRGYL